MNRISERVLGCAYEVSRRLGCGFLEKVYENALAHELTLSGLRVAQQRPMLVRYKDAVVGEYIADLVVQDQVILEIKASKGIDEIHLAQCLNYLRATGLHLALILNFGTPRLQIKRLIHNF